MITKPLAATVRVRARSASVLFFVFRELLNLHPEHIIFPGSSAAARAKPYASETAGFCIDRAMQNHAGHGYIGEFSTIEKLYRDRQVLGIYAGMSEVQRLVIAGNLHGAR